METDIGKKSAYAALIGAIYLIFGLVQVTFSLGMDIGILESLNIDNNVFGGLIIMLVGSIFLFVPVKVKKDVDEGSAFLFTGIFLSILFAGINLFILISSALSAALEGEPLTFLSDIHPIIYLVLLSIIGLYIWRDTYSFRRFSRAGA